LSIDGGTTNAALAVMNAINKVIVFILACRLGNDV
jgi:hypothetical protein